MNESTESSESERSAHSLRRRRLLVVGGWLATAVGWLWYLHASGDGAVDTFQRLVDALRGAWWAIPAYVAIYAVRPLVLFPASLLTIAGGIIFGPVLGILMVTIGANLSAMVAYWVGRSLGAPGGQGKDETTFLARWSTKMRDRSFATVMLLRLALLPYDLVNYAAGLLRIRPGPFLAATAIGSLPGSIAYVLAGASIDRVDEGVSGIDGRVIVASVVLFAVSLVVAKILQRCNVVEKVV